MTRWRGIATGMALGIALCAAAASAAPFPDDATLRHLLSTRIDAQGQATGAVIGMVGPQGRRVYAYGSRAVGDKHLVDGDTVFDIGSLTKVFTALLLADEVQRGELGLDDAAAKHLPAGAHLPQRGRPITLMDLATHTSGLPLRPANLPSKNPANPYAGYGPEQLFSGLAGVKLEHDAGSTYQYSNLGYGLLGQIVAARDHQNLRELIHNRITQPLGMKHTAFALDAAMSGDRATGYDDLLRPAPAWDFGALEGAGGLRSSVNDLLNLLELYLGRRQGPLAAPARLTVHSHRPGGMQPATGIAMAWNIYSDSTHLLIWKNGSVGGYRSFMGYDVRNRQGVVALVNAQTGDGVDDIGLHLLDADLPVNLYSAAYRKEIVLPEKQLDPYTGRYYFYQDGSTVAVTREGKSLYAEVLGQGRFQLHPDGPRSFFVKSQNIQLLFEPAAQNGSSPGVIWRQENEDSPGKRVK